MNNNNDEEKNPVRKLLKDLPEMKASPDFEQRLQRRIVQEETAKEVRILGKLFRPRYVPVFSYSLVALVAVGVVSYYVFMRTEMHPPSSMPLREPSAPAEQKTGVPSQNAQPQSEDKAAENNQDPSIKGGFNRRDVPVKSDRKVSLKQREEKPSVSETKDAEELNSAQSIQFGDNATGDAGQLNKLQNNEAVRVESLTQPSTTGSTQMFNTPQVQNKRASYLRAVSLLDSLKQDSLRKAQKQLQLQQQKAKSKSRRN